MATARIDHANQRRNQLSIIIQKLEKNINEFDYKGLRSESTEIKSACEDSLTLGHASVKSVLQLVNLLTPKEFNLLNESFSIHSADEQDLLLNCAELLTRFKNNIQDAEKEYFTHVRKESESKIEFYATLREGPNWVSYFHFVIEQHSHTLPPGTLQDYRFTIKSLKKLYEKCDRLKLNNKRKQSESDGSSFLPGDSQRENRRKQFRNFFDELSKSAQTQEEPLASQASSGPKAT